MTRPVRVQRRRTKGWRMPKGVYVGRPSKWGNIYKIGDVYVDDDGDYRTIQDAETAVRLFREWVTPYQSIIEEHLRGKNLCCWCRLCPAHENGKPLEVECSDCHPCHADVLLELSNPGWRLVPA